MNRAAICLTGTALAFSLVSLPALAQNNAGQNNTGQNTTRRGRRNRANRDMNRTMNMQRGAGYTYASGDMSLPVADETQEAWAIHNLTERGFGRAEIESVLPLLADLQTAENNYYDATYMAAFTALGSNNSSASTPDEYQNARQMYRDRHDAIWSTIRQKVGDDRANALQALVEPVPMSTTDIAYSSPHLTRIDQLLAEWDQEAATRMAANGGTPTTTTTTTTVSVENAPTTPAVPVTIYSFPPLTTTQLISLLQNRLAVLVGTPEAAMSLQGRPITSTRLQYLEQRKLGTWTWGTW